MQHKTYMFFEILSIKVVLPTQLNVSTFQNDIILRSMKWKTMYLHMINQ